MIYLFDKIFIHVFKPNVNIWVHLVLAIILATALLMLMYIGYSFTLYSITEPFRVKDIIVCWTGLFVLIWYLRFSTLEVYRSKKLTEWVNSERF
mgnify:CR=1 FL=1